MCGRCFGRSHVSSGNATLLCASPALVAEAARTLLLQKMRRSAHEDYPEAFRTLWKVKTAHADFNFGAARIGRLHGGCHVCGV
jgi:hypothetical protein